MAGWVEDKWLMVEDKWLMAEDKWLILLGIHPQPFVLSHSLP